jgi:hypothetical protein
VAARAQQRERMRRIGVLLRVAQDDPDAQRDLQIWHKAAASPADGMSAAGGS